MIRPQPASDADDLGRLFLTIVPAAMLAVLLWRPIANSDLFWQLTFGDLTLAHGGPILREPFSALHLSEPTPTLGWAGQALMAWVRSLAGWSGLKLFHAFCWCGGFWAVAAACRHRGASRTTLAIALALAFTAALPLATMRPQSLAVLCFGVLLALVRLEPRPLPAALVAAPLFIAWQNFHPSVSIALAVLGPLAAVRWLVWWRDRSARAPIAETVLFPIAAIAMICTPDGWSIFETSARNAELSLMLGASEWFPLWDKVNRQVALPVVVIAGLTGFAIWRRRERIDLGEAAVSLVLFAMTLLVYRFVLFWAISLIPLLARTGIDVRAPWRLRLPRFSPLIAVMLTAALLIAARPIRFGDHLAFPAIARLSEEGVSGTIYADFAAAGPLLHQGYPRWKVAYDGRYYLYSRAEWDRFRSWQREPGGLDRIIETYRPAAFVLRYRRSLPLIAQIERRPQDWRRIWKDERLAIFVPVRPSGRPKP